MRMDNVRLLKITTDFKLEDVTVDLSKAIIGDALYGDGSLAQEVVIRYPVLLNNLKNNGIFSRFVMLVDEEGFIKKLDLNLVGTILYGVQNSSGDFAPIVGDVYIVKVGRYDFVDMYDREYEIIKSQLSGMINVVVQNLESVEFNPNDPGSFGEYEE